MQLQDLSRSLTEMTLEEQRQVHANVRASRDAAEYDRVNKKVRKKKAPTTKKARTTKKKDTSELMGQLSLAAAEELLARLKAEQGAK